MKIVSKLAMLGLLFAAVVAQAASVNANVYTGTLGGDGSPFTGFVGAVTSPDFLFYTDNGGNWHPFALSAFASDITGAIDVAASGTYALQYGSDDGSQLFIDGISIANLPGEHNYSLGTYNTSLTAGVHSVEIYFWENGVGPSGVDLFLPSGITITNSTPEPGTMLLFGTGLAGLAGIVRRKLRM